MNALYRQAVESAHEGIWVVDTNWKTTLVNPRMCEMIGYQAKEILGRTPNEFIDPSALPQWDALVSRREHGVGESHDFIFRRKNGAELWLMVSAAPLIEKSGNFSGAVAIMTDITDRRLLEQRLRDAQRQEAVSVMAGSVVSHFNARCQPLLAQVDLALEDFLLTGDLRKLLQEIRDSAASIRQVAVQLNDTTEPDQSKRKSMDAGGLVQAVVNDPELARPSYVDVSVEVRTKPLPVKVDAVQLGAAIGHLYKNALQAIDPSRPGTVRLSVNRVHLSNQEAEAMFVRGGPYVCIEVEDSGRGMSPESLQRAFDPFFSTRTSEKAWGIGLTYALGVIRAHGGAIRASSELGVGTIVRVCLPVGQVASAAKSASPSASDSHKPGIVFVDDSRDAVEAWSEFLELQGYRVRVFCDAVEAAQFVTNHPDQFDLIITDLTMPGISGIEILERLRQVSPAKPAPLRCK